MTNKELLCKAICESFRNFLQFIPMNYAGDIHRFVHGQTCNERLSSLIRDSGEYGANFLVNSYGSNKNKKHNTQQHTKRN